MPAILGFDTQDLTFGRMLPLKADRNAEKLFLHYVTDGRKFSYGDVDMLSNRIANGFIAHGISRRSHVAVMMENCPEQILSYFALGKIGAVFAPLNPAASGHFLEYYINHSDATAIVVEEHLLDQVRQIAAQVPQLTRAFVLKGGPDVSAPVAPPVASLREVDFAELLDHPDKAPGIETQFTDLCSLMYTSGTTGPSKANMFSQTHTMMFGMASRRVHTLTSKDIAYCPLPLFHAGAWNTYTCGSLLDDASVALVRRFSVSRFWDDIRASGATMTALTAVTHFLEAQLPSPDDRNHSLRLLICGPMPKDPQAFMDRFGVTLGTNFGLTDYCLTHYLSPGHPQSKLGSCGRTLEGCHAKIVDDLDFEVPAGVAGEIVVRNDTPWMTSLGYYKNPAATAEAFRNSWYHTGDRGIIDEDGFLWYKDRKKDSLRRRGENISASEVEAAILKHDLVAEVAIYGIRAEGTDDEVCASIVPVEGADIDLADFAKWCGNALPYYLVPRFIEVIEQIPRTLNHKVQKVVLKEAMQAHWRNAWDREAHGIIFTRKKG